MAKNYEELEFTDDFMFGKVMEDKDLCRELLECLLGHPVGILQEVTTEKQIHYLYDGKPIRLDVYSKDQNAVYDAEMQNLNHKSIEGLELPLRSRFYQALMDADMLYKGTSYRNLPEMNVIFICTFDPFLKGIPRYIFETRCKEDETIRLENKVLNVFYNCTCRDENIPAEVRALFQYIQTGAENSELVKRIHSAVKKARQNEKWRSEYMKEMILFDDLRAEGRAEGERGRDLTLILRWLDKGKTISEIAEDLGRSEEYVEQLCKTAVNE